MAIPGYRWVRGLVREQRYEQARQEKGNKTWDEWLDERIVPAPHTPPATPGTAMTSSGDVREE